MNIYLCVCIGNIIYRTGGYGKVGLLDWGQMKRMPEQLLVHFANMIDALNSKNQEKIVEAFFKLGFTVDQPNDWATVEGIAKTMLDTKVVPGYDMNPFSDQNALKSNAVTSLPPDIYFVIRTVQLLRGIAFAFNVDYSLAETWAPYARRVLKDDLNLHRQI